MTEREVHDLVFKAALQTIAIGAPGLAEATRRAIAVNIAIKAAHALAEASVTS